ncbi:TPA: hypothetical protein L3H12_001593 [Acinetobacter baumannii]|uniref:hypothetical protein n=1 Tax=Acinetobacter baumannii TaxID=470 RepID=UPI000402F1E8|nr:hypothetical protein [Acinetobacter baumannii]MBT8177301.1 hypothetical protein [Acinetobacter baumannii]OTT28136.1 hypothetical protein CAS81_11050 [Acinetobacter baumannii]RSP33738.1 hypothetical protein EA730_04440 [Acinetobacter baumannii]TPS15778.1 hypothetical protein FJV06_01550 [Acinetobacter baumannii]HBN5964890.1 hypothetical protein [Acinetobacter baumannii]
MSINNSQNELYNDFVKLVEDVSSSVVKQTIVPISGQLVTASNALEKTSNEIGSIAGTAINQVVTPISKQLNLTAEIMKQASNDIGSIEKKINQNGIKLDNLNIQIIKDASEIKEHSNELAELVLRKLDQEIALLFEKKIDQAQILLVELQQQNKKLETQIIELRRTQKKLFSWGMGFNIIFSLLILAALLFSIWGAK